MARVALFLYVVVVACPIRYWPVTFGIDPSWIFALNYGAAHGLAFGRDLAWTTGPLGYLVFPMDVGANLVKGLAFQSAIWAVAAATFADLFFRSGIPLRNLAIFSICFGLAAPWFWINYLGTENLLIACVLTLLVMVRLRGGAFRYVAALVLIGLVPLIKLTGGAIAVGALAGFLLDRALRLRRAVWRDALLGVAVPAFTAALVWWLTLPSFEAFRSYLAASREIASGFSAAMSVSGARLEFIVAIEVLTLLAILLATLAHQDWRLARFSILLLVPPLAIGLKHGFVRQDYHVLNFMCFVCLCIGLTSLKISWTPNWRLLAASSVLLPLIMLWQDHLTNYFGLTVPVVQASGLRGVNLARKAALNFSGVRRELREESETDFQAHPEGRLEPALRQIVGGDTVGFMSIQYSGAYLDGLNLRLYPVVQRYSAYTRDLDAWNARWIATSGPRYLVFDGGVVDARDAWAETPAMWLEVYRWYDTRLLGERNLLLVRRAQPRFARLESTGRTTVPLRQGVRIPSSTQPVFFSMACGLNTKGRLQKALFRVPEVDVVGQNCRGASAPRRAIIDVFASPVMGNFLPGSLADFATLFSGGAPSCPVAAFAFDKGLGSYGDACEVEYWRAVN